MFRLPQSFGAVLLAMLLTGCSAAGALSAATSLVGSKPDMTAQVGAENTKQTVGITAKQDSNDKVETGDIANSKVTPVKQGSDATQVQDVTGGSVNASKQREQITTGSVQAKTVYVTTSDTRSLLASYALGLGTLVGLIMWFVPSPRRKKQNVGTTDSTGSTS